MKSLKCPAKVDADFAIGSILRLQVPGVRMAKGWALGKFGDEFGPGTQTYAGAPWARIIWQSLRLGSSNLVYFCEPALRTVLHVCQSYVRFREPPHCRGRAVMGVAAVFSKPT